VAPNRIEEGVLLVDGVEAFYRRVDDPYLSTDFARKYAQRLPNAELKLLPGAGHWPWIDQPSALNSVLEFLSAR
jgi:pimeloyl-ACP methyl ester carboxylesterase